MPKEMQREMVREQRSTTNTHRSRLPLVVLLLPLLLGAVADADENHAAILGVEAVPCPARLLAGEHACPGCGLSRATALAVHGDWSRSWSVHPAGIVLALLCACGIGLRLSLRFAPRHATVRESMLRAGPRIFILGILAGWVLRLVG